MATGRSAMNLAVFKILKISGPAISNPVSTLDPGFNYLRNSSINLKISTSEIHIILHIKTKNMTFVYCLIEKVVLCIYN